MKFIFLTQYYPPETGAPQNRLHSLALNLKHLGHEVVVLTAMPNYPKMEVFPEYKKKLFVFEHIDGIQVYRCWIYIKKSASIVPRLMNYFSFVLSSIITGYRLPSADFVLCESPPLFLGWSARFLCWTKRAKLIFNVSDLWPESAEKLDIIHNKILLKMAYALESQLYKKAYLVTGQTQGIVKDIKTRFPQVNLHWLPNGIDEEAYIFDSLEEDWRINHGLLNKKIFLYAGIIGHAQGLEVIIRAAALLKDHTDIAFVIVGDGPVKESLVKQNEDQGTKILFIPNISKKLVLRMVRDAYGYIVPLRRLDIFKGAIPSKVFDPLALSIPVLLGVEGEAKELFVDQGRAGLAFEPENPNELSEVILQLVEDPEERNEMGKRGQEYVKKYFNRRDIAKTFLDQL